MERVVAVAVVVVVIWGEGGAKAVAEVARRAAARTGAGISWLVGYLSKPTQDVFFFPKSGACVRKPIFSFPVN